MCTVRFAPIPALLLLVACPEMPFRNYEVPTLPEEPVLKAVHAIAAGLERADVERIAGAYAPDFRQTAYDPGRWAADRDSRGLAIMRWEKTGVAAPIDRAGMREEWKRYLSGYRLIPRAEIKPRDLHVKESPTTATFMLDVHGVDTKGRFRNDRLYLRLTLREDQGTWVITGQEIVEGDCAVGASRRFRDVAREAGVAYPHLPGQTRREQKVDEGFVFVARGDSGVAAADYDNDGCVDLYFSDGTRNALFRNRGDGTFDDATKAAGLEAPQNTGRSAIFFDADNDGDVDLFVAYDYEPCRFYENRGDGTFRLAENTGTEIVGLPTSLSAVDYDGDGLLDLYVGVYGNYYQVYPEIMSKNGDPNVLFKNLGGLKFKDVAREAGVDDRGWTLAVGWFDFDDDGDPDLLVCNDFGANALYRNDGRGRFKDITRGSGVAIPTFGMGVSFGDYDGDGDLDVYLAGMYSNAGQWIFKRTELLPIPIFQGIRQKVLGTFDVLTDGNRLLRNDGRGQFTDVAKDARVDYGQFAWCSPFVDVDNDGWQDLYSCNGYWSGPESDDL
jgi:hypothetical protein